MMFPLINWKLVCNSHLEAVIKKRNKAVSLEQGLISYINKDYKNKFKKILLIQVHKYKKLII